MLSAVQYSLEKKLAYIYIALFFYSVYIYIYIRISKIINSAIVSVSLSFVLVCLFCF